MKMLSSFVFKKQFLQVNWIFVKKKKSILASKLNFQKLIELKLYFQNRFAHLYDNPIHISRDNLFIVKTVRGILRTMRACFSGINTFVGSHRPQDDN